MDHLTEPNPCCLSIVLIQDAQAFESEAPSESILPMQAIQAFVRQAITYIDHAPDQDTKVALIKTLQAVTEGKVRRSFRPGHLTGYKPPRVA